MIGNTLGQSDITNQLGKGEVLQTARQWARLSGPWIPEAPCDCLNDLTGKGAP